MSASSACDDLARCWHDLLFIVSRARHHGVKAQRHLAILTDWFTGADLGASTLARHGPIAAGCRRLMLRPASRRRCIEGWSFDSFDSFMTAPQWATPRSRRRASLALQALTRPSLT